MLLLQNHCPLLKFHGSFGFLQLCHFIYSFYHFHPYHQLLPLLVFIFAVIMFWSDPNYWAVLHVCYPFRFFTWVPIVFVSIMFNWVINNSCEGYINRLWPVIIILGGIIINIRIRFIALIGFTVRFGVLGIIVIFIFNGYSITNSKYNTTFCVTAYFQHMYMVNDVLWRGYWVSFAPID